MHLLPRRVVAIGALRVVHMSRIPWASLKLLAIDLNHPESGNVFIISILLLLLLFNNSINLIFRRVHFICSFK